MSNKIGKITPDYFKSFIESRCGSRSDSVKTKPKFGVDVSVVHLSGGQALAMASDPLSLIPQLGLKESAWLSVQLTANDIATTGFAPLYGQFVLNLPARFSSDDFQTYWGYIHEFCSDMGLAITGGHTGFVEGQHSTLVGGATFLTLGPQDQLLTAEGAQVNDVILVTKSCALSSSAILALSFPETVRNKAGVENYQVAADSFYRISVLKEALGAKAGDHGQYITAMHDVTEGGLLGAIYELAFASHKGAWVEDDKIPIHAAQAEVCKVFSLDPRYCIGAGSMIMTCKEEGVKQIINHLQAMDIPCVAVGRITSKEKGINLVEAGKSSAISYIEKDPYWAAFLKAVKQGWK